MSIGDSEAYSFPTLPDYLKPGLDLVFVGINPSVYAVEHGHYFARPTNRFWPAISRSRLTAPIRQALGVGELRPEHDAALLDFGIGFTDVVKRPSNSAGTLRDADFREWVPRLRRRLEPVQPRVACFHGVTGYRPFARYALDLEKPPFGLGEQEERLGDTRLFVVPNPSPANAVYSVADLAGWYDRLAEFLEGR